MSYKPEWKMNAYAQVSAQFNLKWRQRDMLDACDQYEQIMEAGRDEDWDTVEIALRDAGIIEGSYF